MARNTRFFLGRSQARERDADDAEFAAYDNEPSNEPERRSAPDYAMPLFLSEDAGRTRRQVFPTSWAWNWKGVASRPRVIKAGIVAAAAAVIAFGAVYSEASFDLFATVKASLFGTSTDQSAVAETSTQDAVAAAVQSTPNTSSPFTQSTVGVRTTSSIARGAPTRDDIASALRTARQGPPDLTQSPGASPPARSLNPDAIAVLVKRGKALISLGDIAAARLLLERAADAQDAGAALLLAQTYDPAVIGKADVRTITPDPTIARGWYQRAAALGSPDAKQRLTQMQN